MNNFGTGMKLRAHTVTLLAGVLTLLMSACSKDHPTDPGDNPAAGKPQADGPVAVVPTNDDFDAPKVITTLPFTDSDNTADATVATDDPACVGDRASVWYRFTPAEDTRINANTVGSDYDTDLSVYTGTRENLTQIACNDDAIGLASSVTFDAEAGVTYYFMVGALGPGGNLVFNVDVAPPAVELDLTLDPVGSVNGATGIATIRGTVSCSQPTSVDISGDLRQRVGRVFIDAFFSTFVECDGVTAWEAEVVPVNGLLVGGRVQVFVGAFVFDPGTGEFVSDEESGVVRLRGRGK